MMKIGVLARTKAGRHLAEKIAAELDGVSLGVDNGVAAVLETNWSRFDGFICIMAAGIVVRSIAPLLEDKYSDPAVVVLDEKGAHCISLLSGHLGGGNSLAHRVAEITCGTPVITTASDTRKLVPLDLWAAAQQLVASDRKVFTRASSLLVNEGYLPVFSEVEIDELPPGLVTVETVEECELIISRNSAAPVDRTLHPRNLVVGVGCNRNTPVEEFEEALEELFDELALSRLSIRNLSTIDAKKDEKGLIRFAENNGWDLEIFSRDEINRVSGVDISDAALKAVGAIGVAEPAALLSAKTQQLLSRKRKWQNITMAVAEAPFTLSARVQDRLNT